MATESLLVRDLAIVMMAAAAAGLLFQRLRQPSVLGYIVAGVLIGPHVVPGGLIRDAASIGVLAELGTLFLLFSLGLDFHLGKLRRVGGLAFTAGALQMSLMVALGAVVARLFGWAPLDALFLGAVLAISGGSTIVKVLQEAGLGAAPTTQVVIGIVVVERIGGIVLLAVLTSLATTGGFELAPLGSLVVRLGLFILIALVLGVLIVPRLVDAVARVRVQESLVLALLGIAFGLALLSSGLGLTSALGAFIAGALIAESRAGPLAAQRVAPLRDAFVAVFFVAMGLLLDPRDVARYWVFILAVTALVVVGKTFTVAFSTLIAGYPPRDSFNAGISMGMLGGFALVIANLGQDLGVTQPFLFPVVLAATATTTLVTPLLMRRSGAIVDAGARMLPMRVRRYTRMYVAWMARHRPGESELYRQLHVPDLVRVGAYSALLATLVVGGALLARRIVGPDLGLTTGQWIQLGPLLAGMLLLAIPLGIGLVRAAGRVRDHVVAFLVPHEHRERAVGRAIALLVRATAGGFAYVVVAAILLTAGSIFLPPAPLLLGAAAAAVLFAYFTRASLVRVDREVEEALDTLIADQAAPGTREDLLGAIQDRADWDLRVEGVLLPERSGFTYRRIEDVQLPARTGASILAVTRGDEPILNPPPDLVLKPGDVLTVVGSLDQVDDAKSLLASEAEPTPRSVGAGVRVDEVELSPRSALAGVPLAESRLREATGVSVVGLRRGAVVVPNPGPEVLLQPGDVLLVVGSRGQVAEARRLISPPPPP